MKKKKNIKLDSSKFWCRDCGSPDIRGYYSFYGRGVCKVTQVGEDGQPYDYDDYDDHDQDDWQLQDVECEDCEKQGDPEEVITTEVDLVKDKKNFRWE